MSRKRVDLVGLQVGYIKVVKELNKKCGHRYFLMKCDLCDAEKRVSQSSISQGAYNVCEHDAL